MLIFFEQLSCQAHGPAGVMSNRAIGDLDLQHCSSYGVSQLAGVYTGASSLTPKFIYEIISSALQQFSQECLHRLIGRARLDLLGSADLAQSPPYDHRDTMAQLRGFVQIMRDKDRAAMIFLQKAG